jgi:hypothetical protein
VGIAEDGAINTPRVLDDATVGSMKPSELYTMLKGAGSAPPAALLEAESRAWKLGPNDTAPPVREATQSGRAPQFYTASDQSWFASNFCPAYWQCIQGGAASKSWAMTSYGNHHGRGYTTNGMVGSESAIPGTLETDWWNGSAWAALGNITVQPAHVMTQWSGNTGAPASTDGDWYFRSEVIVNYPATVSLSDHVWAGGTSCNPCGASSMLPGTPCGYWCWGALTCSDPQDTCVNPP